MVTEHALLAGYPRETEIDPQRVADQAVADASVLVVLDDAPTGTQSVADLPVLPAATTGSTG